MKKNIIIITILLFVDLLAYYLCMPALNIQSLALWYYLAFCLVPFIIWYLIKNSVITVKEDNRVLFVKPSRNATIMILAGLSLFILVNFAGLPLFGGVNAYRNRIEIPTQSDFSQIEEFDSSQVQIIDKNVAESLADRVFGELGAETVSRYKVSDLYSSCIINNTMYRITPAEYSGLIKWLSTNKEGTPGFIIVNVTTGETELIKTEGLKYTPDAYFFNNLNRHLRLKYPTSIFGRTRFECDDNMKPYFITQVMSYHFVGKAKDVKGVVITDPITGECQYCNVSDVPSWLDNVYDAELICSQYNSYGRYINGLINFSQKGETATTDDYAYLQKDGHLWMYTGITSVGNDESNVGFVYVDLQDKEVIYIVSAGAEEYSARSSAEGALQEKGYTSIFPTMVSINNNPVYFMGLKDNGGLIKAYAFVDYKDYQKVGVGTTVKEALKDFKYKNGDITFDSQKKTITIKELKTAVVNGYTIYYILDTEGNYYSCSIEISEKLPFIKIGDTLNVEVSENVITKLN